MRPAFIPLDMFSLFFMSAKSNGITKFFVKSILVKKFSQTSIYDIIMSSEHFGIKNKDWRPL